MSREDDVVKTEPEEGKKPSLEEQVRTERQNRAIHLWFRQIADTLNDGGLSIKEVLQHFRMDVPWTEKSVKSILWYTAQKRMFEKDSTAKLTTKEATRIEEVVSRFLNLECGVNIPFPSVESEYYSSQDMKPIK